MKLIVGLGNPDSQYLNTRHNAGYWVVDALATKYGAELKLTTKFRANFAKSTTPAGPLLLAQPTTYMNASGEAVGALLQFYKIEPTSLLVIHDDVSIPLGKIRVQSGGGAGGQHGVEDIIHFHGANFDRIKFGVGPDPGGDRRADYVLKPVPADDEELKQKVIKLALEAAEHWLKSGVQSAANKFNGLDLRPLPPPPPPPAPPSAEEAPSTPLPGDL